MAHGGEFPVSTGPREKSPKEDISLGGSGHLCQSPRPGGGFLCVFCNWASSNLARRPPCSALRSNSEVSLQMWNGRTVVIFMMLWSAYMLCRKKGSSEMRSALFEGVKSIRHIIMIHT